MYTAAIQADQLASAAVTGWATTFGVAVVAVLLLAFWWGSRRAARRRMPPKQPQHRADSWHEPQQSETHHAAHSSGHSSGGDETGR